MKLREFAKEHPEGFNLQLEAINVIGRLVKIQYQISSEQEKSLAEAIHKVLTEIAVPLGINIRIGHASE